MNVPSDHRKSREIIERPPFQVSFEFFPPKTDVMEERFWESIHRLAPPANMVLALFGSRAARPASAPCAWSAR